MTFAAKGPAPGGRADPLELSRLGGVDLQGNIPNEAQAQDKFRNPCAVLISYAKHAANVEKCPHCGGVLRVRLRVPNEYRKIVDSWLANGGAP
jgi:hypothetical protein